MVFLLLIAAPAFAQDPYAAYLERQKNLTRLSEIFGELHHIRRTCEPRREADVWRNRMKRLVSLEEPTAQQRNAMVEAFNKGYAAARKSYIACERNAEDRAAAAALEGEQLVAALTAPLRPAETELENGAYVTRGGGGR